jgi:transcriptional regulator with XRE-family HTH domain
MPRDSDPAGRPSNDAAKLLGASLRQWREARGWSLRQFAQRLGYSTHSELSAYERGERVLPASRVDGVATLLRVDAALVAYMQRAAADERGGRKARAGNRTPVVVGNVRPRPPTFVGRHAVLAQLDDAVGARPLTWLRGDSGIGVREIAAEFIARRASSFAHAEWRHGVHAFSPEDSVLPRLVVIEGAVAGEAVELLTTAVADAGGRVIGLSTAGIGATDIVIERLDHEESAQLLAERLPGPGDHLGLLADACAGSPLSLELAAAIVAQAGIGPAELAARAGGGVTEFVRVAAEVLRAADPIAWQLLEWLAAEGTDVTTRERLVATHTALPELLAQAVTEELPILDAVARLHSWALVRTAPGHLWTHASVRESVLLLNQAPLGSCGPLRAMWPHRRAPGPAVAGLVARCAAPPSGAPCRVRSWR